MKRKINVTLTIIAMFAVVASTIGVTIVSYNLFENQVRNDLKITAELLDDTGIFDRAYSGRNEGASVNENYFKHLANEKLRITAIVLNSERLCERAQGRVSEPRTLSK